MPVPTLALDNIDYATKTPYQTQIPVLGLGTWQSKDEEVTRAVVHALTRTELRHIDCAQGYLNEAAVGAGIKAAIHASEQSGYAGPKLSRADIFVTSKVWGTWHNRVEEALDATLKKLDLEYLDLYLIHWPIPLNPQGTPENALIPTLPSGERDVIYPRSEKGAKINFVETWRQMEKLVGLQGKVRSIGVSNFSKANLEILLKDREDGSKPVKPAVNQLELHVYNPQHKLVKYLLEAEIRPQAYSPLGSTGSPLLADAVVIDIANRHQLKPADVLIGYLIHKNIITVAKSVNPARISANVAGPLQALEKLQPSDIATLDGLAATGKQKRFIKPVWPAGLLKFEDWD
ncbi:Aldo/keto reductase [Mycena maculata]|uniref:Aldo/keto reductase n=1 Tax=Mycena maculata TaxID=230809 RepID=A0AAD7P2K1_9AGAR|nr:Aldo/keto reductase [Mycena maculata]